jgi:hypothetical protein
MKKFSFLQDGKFWETGACGKLTGKLYFSQIQPSISEAQNEEMGLFF